MKPFYLLLLLFPSSLFAQWNAVNGINFGRNDDIFFVNDSVGYVAGGNRKTISKTTDGGDNWIDIFNTNEYVRCIEFIDASTGFAGTLDSGFYMTVDSGATWNNIASTISPIPAGICGISIPNDSTIYACGFFNQPAFVIKSTDRGLTWTYIDMSAQAKALVEAHFISTDTGFVAGRANPFTDGGVILRTTDGGVTWNSVAKTFGNLDYVWKIQNPDKSNYFAAISSSPAIGNTTFLKSADAGLTWTKSIVDTAWSDIQMIGFVDSLHGWTGGQNDLFETTDGGLTWNKNNASVAGGGSFYNRFIIKNDSTAFISGLKIYKYSSNSISTLVSSFQGENGDIHRLTVLPNPTSRLNAELVLETNTSVSIKLVGSNGQLLEELFRGRLGIGNYRFVAENRYPPQIAFLVVRTNEGLLTEKVVLVE